MSIGEVTSHTEMRKKRGLRSALLGVILGFVVGFLVANFRLIVPLGRTSSNATYCKSGGSSRRSFAMRRASEDPMDIVHLSRDDTIDNSATNLVFVGVMTAEKYLDSRAKAVYETWGSGLPGKIAFFSSESSTVPENCPDLPLVALPQVDDSYPPQKKSFLMLQYMWQNFGDKFEWFLRADDDVYVRTDRLEKLLRSVDSRQPRYIGQAGRGNSEEFGLLSLEYDENFCMGGPGVVLSRETLRRVVPHIRYCLKNLYTTHEDVELGRCVQKYAGIPCTWSYEMQSILYHNSSGDHAFTGNLKRKEVHRAITLHPVKSPPHMYRLHNYMRSLRIQELQHLKVELHRDIRSMMAELGVHPDEIENYMLAENVPLFPAKSDSESYLGDTKVLGIPAGLRAFKPKTSNEVIPWDFLSRSEYSLTDSNPRRRIHSDVREGLEDITREVMASINACSRQRGRVVEERSILYGYRRVDAYGADTVLDLLLVYRKYRGRKVTLPVRRHVYVHQHFTGLEIREVVDGVDVREKAEENTERTNSLGNVLRNGFFNLHSKTRDETLDPVRNKVIRFILPLSGRHETLKRFLRVYEEICLVSNEKTSLMIILFPHELENTFNESISLVNRLKYDYPDKNVEVIPTYKNFSRALALEIGVSRCDDDDLMLFCDVDIVFTNSALHRIRLNTVTSKQIYFPIVFSQFDPKIVYAGSNMRDTFVANNFNGYWREYGFGIVSVYKKDFRAIGGFDLAIRGWGKEDVDLFEKAVRSNLTTFRAVDRHLVHVFHEVQCDPRLSGPQKLMCEGSKADTYASTEQLAKMIYDNPEYLKYAKILRTRNATPAA